MRPSESPSVCPCVRLLIFEVPFQRFFALISRRRMSKILEIPNFLGKVVERSGLRFEHFPSKIVLKCSDKKSFLRILKNLVTFEVSFKRLFVPTSKSWMSNFFRDSESLEKNNLKKWSQV